MQITKDEFIELRVSTGLSVSEAARQSNTPLRTWQNWECKGGNARRVPGIAVAWLRMWIDKQKGKGNGRAKGASLGRKVEIDGDYDGMICISHKIYSNDEKPHLNLVNELTEADKRELVRERPELNPYNYIMHHMINR